MRLVAARSLDHSTSLRSPVPLRLYRVDLALGTRTESLVSGPLRQAGVRSVGLGRGAFDPARGYAYGYRRQLAALFLVK